MTEEKLPWSLNRKYKQRNTEVAENSDASSKNLQSELKKKLITTPSKRRRKISKSVENVRRDRRRTVHWRGKLSSRAEAPRGQWVIPREDSVSGSAVVIVDFWQFSCRRQTTSDVDRRWGTRSRMDLCHNCCALHRLGKHRLILHIFKLRELDVKTTWPKMT